MYLFFITTPKLGLKIFAGLNSNCLYHVIFPPFQNLEEANIKAGLPFFLSRQLKLIRPF